MLYMQDRELTRRFFCRVLQQTDGVLTFDAAEYYPEVALEFRDWFAETSRKVHYVGPLVPDNRVLPSLENGQRAQGGVLSFLDDQLAVRGARSVVYVRRFSVCVGPSCSQRTLL